MNGELEVLETVTRRLEAIGVRYMVSGSMAMNDYYAQPRMTRDIDLVCFYRNDFDTETFSRILRRFRQRFKVPETRRGS